MVSVSRLEEAGYAKPREAAERIENPIEDVGCAADGGLGEFVQCGVNRGPEQDANGDVTVEALAVTGQEPDPQRGPGSEQDEVNHLVGVLDWPASLGLPLINTRQVGQQEHGQPPCEEDPCTDVGMGCEPAAHRNSVASGGRAATGQSVKTEKWEGEKVSRWQAEKVRRWESETVKRVEGPSPE